MYWRCSGTSRSVVMSISVVQNACEMQIGVAQKQAKIII